MQLCTRRLFSNRNIKPFCMDTWCIGVESVSFSVQLQSKLPMEGDGRSF